MASDVILTLGGLLVCTAAFYGLLFLAAYVAKKVVKE